MRALPLELFVFKVQYNASIQRSSRPGNIDVDDIIEKCNDQSCLRALPRRLAAVVPYYDRRWSDRDARCTKREWE